MKKVIAVIAGVTVLVETESESLYQEVCQQYNAYVLEDSNTKTPDLYIHIGEGEKSSNQKGKHLYITCRAISAHLLWFNDIFRIFFLQFFYQFSGVALHASSVILDDTGFLFIGKEGVGKSTKRSALRQLTSLGDDIALLTVNHGEVTLHGSPFYQKTRINYPNVSVNNVYFLYLKQAKINMIMQEHQPLKRLLNNSFSGHQSLPSHFQLVSELSNSGTHYQYQNTVSKQPEPLLHALLSIQNHSIPRIKQQINASIRNTIDFTNCTWGVLYASSTKDFQVIHEESWLFEFNAVRTMKKIAQACLSATNRTTSPHRILVRRYIQSLNKEKSTNLTIVLRKSNNTFEVIDGNHRLLASLCRYLEDDRDQVVTFLAV